MIALRRPEGAAKGLNVDTVKRFSDCDWYVLREFSVVPKFGANALAAKRLVISTNVTSKTPLKIQFWIRNGKNLASRAPRAPAAHINYFKTSV